MGAGARQMVEERNTLNWCYKIRMCLYECGLGFLWQRDQAEGLSAKEFKSVAVYFGGRRQSGWRKSRRWKN